MMKHYILPLLVALVATQGCKEDEIDPIVEKPRLLSYTSVSGNKKLTAAYEYDSQDRVTRISWERSSPHVTQGSDVFVFDDIGRLKEQVKSITGLVDERIQYSWDGDKVFASASYVNNKKTGFAFYDYNEDGRLEIVEYYQREGDYGFLRTDSIRFSYHPDGNIFRMDTYSYQFDVGGMILLSTQTFPEYLASPNPVATVDILPTINLQKTLPKEYTVSANNNVISYTFQYELRADGLPHERTVTSAGSTEHTVYAYDKN